MRQNSTPHCLFVDDAREFQHLVDGGRTMVHDRYRAPDVAHRFRIAGRVTWLLLTLIQQADNG